MDSDTVHRFPPAHRLVTLGKSMRNIKSKQRISPAHVPLVLLLASMLAGCAGGHAAIAQATLSLSPNQTEVNGITIPPDPGPQNDNTLAGIDTTGMGARDDVYRAIAAKWGANKVEWKAVLQAAQADQLSVIANGEPALSSAANDAEMFSGTCIADSFGNDIYKPGVHPSWFSFAITNDTPERLAAFERTEAVNTPDIDTPSNGSCK